MDEHVNATDREHLVSALSSEPSVESLQAALDGFDEREEQLRGELAREHRVLALERAATDRRQTLTGPVGWGAGLFVAALLLSLLGRLWS
jgi:hypothetical protein